MDKVNSIEFFLGNSSLTSLEVKHRELSIKRGREIERGTERVRSPKNSDCDDIITMLGISDIDVGGMSPDYLERVLLSCIGGSAL